MLLIVCVFPDEQMTFLQIIIAAWLDGGYMAR